LVLDDRCAYQGLWTSLVCLFNPLSQTCEIGNVKDQNTIYISY